MILPNESFDLSWGKPDAFGIFVQSQMGIQGNFDDLFYAADTHGTQFVFLARYAFFAEQRTESGTEQMKYEKVKSSAKEFLPQGGMGLAELQQSGEIKVLGQHDLTVGSSQFCAHVRQNLHAGSVNWSQRELDDDDEFVLYHVGPVMEDAGGNQQCLAVMRFELDTMIFNRITNTPIQHDQHFKKGVDVLRNVAPELMVKYLETLHVQRTLAEIQGAPGI